MTQRFEGRSLDEALTTAAETLGVERWQLTYHVLLEKRGFLGGVKRIVIEADVNQGASEPPAAPVYVPAAPAAAGRSGPRAARGARPRGNDGNRREGGRRGEGRGGQRGGEQRGGGRGRRERRPEPEFFIGDLPEQGPESELAKAAREWCEQMIRLARLDLVIRTGETDERIDIRLYGADAARVIDRHGELLDAMQVLANKAMLGRSLEKDIELDCEDYKAQRIEDLTGRAMEAAERVREGGREELLPAMSPIERRIIHLALHEDAEVTTESRGEGFFKRVAIIPRPAAADGGGEPAGER